MKAFKWNNERETISSERLLKKYRSYEWNNNIEERNQWRQ